MQTEEQIIPRIKRLEIKVVKVVILSISSL